MYSKCLVVCLCVLTAVPILNEMYCSYSLNFFFFILNQIWRKTPRTRRSSFHLVNESVSASAELLWIDESLHVSDVFSCEVVVLGVDNDGQ